MLLGLSPLLDSCGVLDGLDGRDQAGSSQVGNSRIQARSGGFWSKSGVWAGAREIGRASQ